MNNNEVIVGKQLIFIIISSTVGVGLLTLPDSVGREAQQAAWISVLIGALLPLLGLVLINLIGGRFPNLTFAQFAEAVLGKWLGKLLSLIFVLYCIIYSALLISIFVNMLKIYLFPRTPLWALAALVLAVTLYLAAKDVRVLARVNELMFYEAIVIFFALVLVIPKIDVTFFQPVVDVGLENILKGAYQTVFAFLGMEFLLVFYPMVQNKKEILKNGIVAIGVIMLMYLAVIVTALGVFGPTLIGKLRFSLMVLLKINVAPVIERAEFFFVILYVFVAFRPIATALFAARYTTGKIFGFNKVNYIAVGFFPVVLIISLIPIGFEHSVLLSGYLGIMGIVFLTVIPLTLWLVSVIRKIGGETKNV